MLEQLKKKFNESTMKSEELQVLTVLSQSWTLQRIKEELGATKHMARKAKEVVISKRVLSTPNSRPSKTLSDRTVQLVNLSGAVSRIMPGKRDCISVKVNGKKTLMQKHCHPHYRRCNFCNEDGNAAECVYCSKLPRLKASLM